MNNDAASVKRRRRPIAIAAAALGAAALLGAAGAAAVVWLGLYDVAANRPHAQAVHSLLEATMRQSVRRRAADIDVPPLQAPALLARGAACYRAKCVQCHGGPGVAQGDIGRSMQPLPGPLVDAARRWTGGELYWLTRNGIKMSGMPAWQYRLADEDLWALVAFMQRLPELTAAQFRALDPADGCTPGADAAIHAPDAERGRVALTQYACTACHRVPRVAGSDVHVGPPLAGFARRGLIAGVLPNTSDNLVRWIRDPRSVDAETTMPDMQVRERDARDIAAYLGTLH